MNRPHLQVTLTFAVLILVCVASRQGFAQDTPPADPLRFSLPKVDEAVVKSLRIRKLVGKHLTLYTDLPASDAIDELPEVFDQAVPQWLAYFSIAPESAAKWRIVGSLMKARESFERAGLVPDGTPDFPNALARGPSLWINEQASDYYRRHLLLHEGTHAFMEAFLGGYGPAWYAEGMAELLGTHDWRDGKLTLNVVPASRERVPDWGRIKRIRDDRKAERGKSLPEILAVDSIAFDATDLYAWSWAVCVFLDHDPSRREAFRNMSRQVAEPAPAFKIMLLQEQARTKSGVRDLPEEWEVFLNDLDYGYDVARNTLVRTEPKPLGAEGASSTVAADRGWQSTGLRLQAGKAYRIEASGQCRLATEPKPWISQPSGVTLRYFRGQPLGKLLAATSDEGADDGVSSLNNPLSVGSTAEFIADHDGTLFLKVNDSPAELADNEGEYTVTVKEK